MPFNNYAPQYIFKGQVQSDTAPSANNDLVRKQDVSGLSFISSVDSDYFSVDGNGELSASNLLISDVEVNTTDSSLADFVSNSASSANLGVGDVVILTSPTPSEMYIVKSGSGTNESDYQEIQSGLTQGEVLSHISAGTGINITSGGVISTTITQYEDSNARAALSAGAGISYNSSTGQISSTITQYADSNARAAVSAEAGGALLYASSTGQFRLSINNSGGLSTSGSLAIQFDDSTIGLNSSNQLEFKGDTDDVSEGSTNQYFTDARARAAISATGNISYNSSTGVISTTLTQYADSNARAALSVGNGLDYNSSTGVFDLATAGGLEFNEDGDLEIANGDGLTFSDSGDLEVDFGDFRFEASSQSFTANTAKTITHNLGYKYVQVSVYDSSDNLVHAEVSLTDANNLTITTSDALTGVTVIVSI